MKKKNRYLKKVCAAFLVVVFLLAAAAGTGFYLYTKDYYHAKTRDFPPDEETENFPRVFLIFLWMGNMVISTGVEKL